MAGKQYDVSWPGWNVTGILGHGSYGKVYAIERDVFGHTEKAALKVISIPQNDGEIEELYNDGYNSESITQRFRSYLQDIVREYSLMSEMKGHTNIVYCDDLRYVQHDDGMGWDIYIKMELLTPLPKILKNGFSEKLVIKLGLDICNALILCKSKNIVHRDIKPQNIFVSEDKNFKLGDFGIAKTAERTTSGTKTGTYKYMAPEVYNNQPYGHAADIYSLGMVLYWLLNERRTPFLPLPPKTPTATDEERARDSRFAGFPIPAPAHGSNELKRIVLKACAFSPEDRYKNAAEMRNDLLTLARSGRYTAQNPRMKAPIAKEPPMRAPVPDTDETVGNFGRAQRDKTPIEETVGVFSHNATGSNRNKGTNRSNYTANENNKGRKSKKRRSIGMLITAALVLTLFAVGFAVGFAALYFMFGKKPNEQLTANIQTTNSTELTVATEDIIYTYPQSEQTTPPPETEPVKIHVMAAAEDLTSVDWDKQADQPFWGQTKYLRSDVKSVTFRGTLDGAPDNAWDVSEAKDGSILAWMESGNLIMAADGKIAPNPNASCLFAYFENANAIDFGNCFDTSMVTDMQFMFSDCSSLSELDVSGFDTSMVTDMSAMFQGCNSLTYLDVSGFDTSMVTNMGCMFCGCSSLTELDVSGFDTSRVAGMNLMFIDCSSLTELDVSGFDTSEVTGMYEMFQGCNSLTELDVSGFDTSMVTDMSAMFQGCNSLTELDVSGFDTSKVTSMDNMFCGCTNLNALNLTSFDNNSLPSLENIFLNCNKLTDMQCHNQAIIDKYIAYVQTEPDFWIDVCYHLNGGHDGPDTQRYAVHNQTLTFVHPSFIPYREGYTFAGWLYGDSNAYSIEMPGEIVSWSEMYYSAPLDYYAQWRKNSVASEKSTDIPTERTVAYVNTVDELLDRIAPNTEIVLTNDFYDLSTAKHYGDWTADSYVNFDHNIIWDTQYYRWIAEYDGPALVIHDVENLVIRSSTGDLSRHTISTIPRFANVLTFENCANITLQGFTAGHTKEQGYCRGGVIEFNNCLDTQINSCGLYGCGVVGVYYNSSTNGSISNSDIYDCSYFAVQGFDTSGVSIMNTTVRNIETAFQFTDCEDITVDDREIPGSYCGN